MDGGLVKETNEFALAFRPLPLAFLSGAGMGIAHFFQFPFYRLRRYSRNLGQLFFRDGWFLKDGLCDRSLDVLFHGGDGFAILANQQQPTAEDMLCAADQVGKEVFQERHVFEYIQSDIGIIRPYQSVPEIAGMLLEQGVVNFVSQLFQIFDDEDSGRPRIAFVEWMKLP